MYRVRLEWPQDSTNRSRPGQAGSVGSCRMTRWNNRYAAGARLMAVPGWPLPAFSTASIARTRIVSTARRSSSDQSRVLSVTAVVLPQQKGSAVTSDPTHAAPARRGDLPPRHPYPPGRRSLARLAAYAVGGGRRYDGGD